MNFGKEAGDNTTLLSLVSTRLAKSLRTSDAAISILIGTAKDYTCTLTCGPCN
jgi:uncharacterized ferredoxin-like protein